MNKMPQHKLWLPKLVGQSVKLRPVRVSDAEGILRFVKQAPDVVRNFSFFSQNLTLKRERQYLRRVLASPNDAMFAIEDLDGGREIFYGTCGVHNIDWHNDCARLGYILFNPEAHGRGVAQDALHTLLIWAFDGFGLHLNKVYLNVFTTNTAGLRTDLALGFEFEGRLRDFYKIREEYHDVYHMSILKKEWQKR